MKLCRRTAIVVALALGLAAAGCSEAVGDGDDPHGPGGDLPVGDGGGTGGGRDGGAGGSDGGLEARVLRFDGTSPVALHYGESQDLAFTLRTTGGRAVSGETVRFALTGSGGTLAVDRAATGQSGQAKVRFTAGRAEADLTLRASADRAQDVTVEIRVRVKGTGDVNVTVTSNARIAVLTADVSLYATPAGTAAPACADLGSLPSLPATPHQAVLPALPGSQLFSGLATGSGVTVFAKGKNATGDVVAQGCVEGVTVAGGETTGVTVVLGQLPPVLTGDYDALLRLNLLGAVPQPYEGYVSLATLVLSNPAGVATYYLLAQVDDLLGTHFVDWTPPGETAQRRATLEEVASNPGSFGVWAALSAALDQELAAQLGQTYTDVKTIGGDVRSLVTEFEVGSHFTMTPAAQADTYRVREAWRALVFTWRQGCAAGDLGCARRAFSLDGTRYAPVNVEYNASVAHEPLGGVSPVTERYRVSADPHTVPFSYGAVVLIALNDLVFPRICAGCHSLGDVLASLVNCPSLGAWIAQQVNDLLGVNLVDAAEAAGFCADALAGLATFVEDVVLNLTVGNPPVLGAKGPGLGGGGQFYLVDQDRDLKTELLRDLTMTVGWVDPTDPARSQDLTAPITGYGREAATGCASDAACTAARSCQPIASYLEVRGLEMTCRRAVGAAAGNAACAQDADCRSGICVRAAGAASGRCYAACASSAHCGGVICEPERVRVSLEAVRAGLGSAPAAGCGL